MSLIKLKYLLETLDLNIRIYKAMNQIESEEGADLPIKQFRKQIIQSIKQNRVVVISGRTGCGKSTQVPQYILQDNQNAKIAICEPRRLAATCLADRVSYQLKQKIGNKVGYQIGMDSKISDKTQIIYMTYGILIQQLLFQTNFPYSHIILDQVHERSLQMDFTFIALKKILDNKGKKQTKIIIMSATINSKQFCDHFSTHKTTNQFRRAIITYKQQSNQVNRRGRRRNRDEQDTKTFVNIQFNREDYNQAKSINLPVKNPHKVDQYFLEQIQKKKFEQELTVHYKPDEDVKISDDTYRFAIGLVHFHLKQSPGDILIFVPGMFQIKYLKQYLLTKGLADTEQIIQVHSAFSDELHKKLFDKKIKNKLIIATNIGQSSITLPDCKVVIDFCLTRKNFTTKIKGYSRFETRLASKSNLMQRSGRVGRISDGIVYRLISKHQYQNLQQFQIPEIQCVSLDMAILRAKQIDKTQKSNIFQDLYDVFFNAIQPPKFQQIHNAIQYLLGAEALILKEKTEQKRKKHNCENIHLTKVGQFMVSMPCNIRISKMILKSLQLQITSIIVDIAAILLTQKQFFIHEQKRDNIEQWMHSLVGYDKGNYNDFLLRQNLFSHWRTLFFQSFKKNNGVYYKQKIKPSYSQQTEKILQLFNNETVTNLEWQWCKDRGVSVWVMRDILRISENIRSRLYQIDIKIQKPKQKNSNSNLQNEMVIYCLCTAFDETTCQIQWVSKNSNFLQKKAKLQNCVSVIQSAETTKNAFLEYMDPLVQGKDFTLQQQKGGFIKVYGSSQALSKLLLPKHYNKSNMQRTSRLFKYLASHPPKVSYLFQNTNINSPIRNVTILNDSINKVNIKLKPQLEYSLITDKIFDTKNRYYMGACALVQRKSLILMRMLTAKVVQIEPHVSEEFYCNVYFDTDENYQLPFMLSNKQIKMIRDLRKFNQEQSSEKLIQQPKILQHSKRNNLLTLLHSTPLKPKIEQWTYVYNNVGEKYKYQELSRINIDNCPPLRQIQKNKSYFERYKKWKKQYAEQLYFNFRMMMTKQISIICSECLPNNFVVIQSLQNFDPEKKVLNLNQYRGSWKQKNNILYCSQNHEIGCKLNDDQGTIQFQKLSVYCPYNKIIKFDGEASTIKKVLNALPEGLEELQIEKRKYYEFTCLICSNYTQTSSLEKFMIEKINTSPKQTQFFWKKVSEHMYSKKHIENYEAFKETLETPLNS